MDQTSIGFLVLCVIAAVSCRALADPSDNKGWMACLENADCTSVAVSCADVWQPVNKKYVTEMKKAKTLPICLGTIAKLGPQPISDCVKGICVHVLTGKTWESSTASERNQVIDQRILPCLDAGGIKMGWFMDGLNHPALRAHFVQKLDEYVRHHPSTVDQRMDQIVPQAIPCAEVVAEAKSSKKK